MDSFLRLLGFGPPEQTVEEWIKAKHAEEERIWAKLAEQTKQKVKVKGINQKSGGSSEQQMQFKGGEGCCWFILQQSSNNSRMAQHRHSIMRLLEEERIKAKRAGQREILASMRAVRVARSPPQKAESPTLDEPWRELDWGEKQENLKYVQEYKPEQDDIRYLRVLLYGPVGAGKSSFINSVSSVLRGRMTIPALASATTSDKSFTKKYETHKFNKGRGRAKTFYPLVFNDFMGLEDGTDRGVHADDIKLALEGHLKEGYEFNQVAPISQDDPGYNPTPSADDRVHVLVCVMSANTPQMNSSVLEKMKSVRDTARDLGIPQMAMMTRIDEACCETDKDLRNVYKSKYLRKKMKDFSSAVGIPVNCIFPVKNYSEEIDMNDDVDTLILSALRKMVDFGDDFIEKAEMAAVGAEDNNMEVNCSAGEKDHKAASQPEGPKLETALQIYQPGNSHTETSSAMMDNLGMEQDDGDESSSEKSTGSNTDDPPTWSRLRDGWSNLTGKLPTPAKPEQSNQTTDSKGYFLSNILKSPAPVVKVNYTPTSDTFGADTAIIKQLKNNLKSSVQLEKNNQEELQHHHCLLSSWPQL
ncbi:uncharacterized protein LOC116723092 isoform X4 [Xiphophorus hellerii]|uniref:uncharacterized protein LOC116723092 isoform X4 n=1 Tax=Xiphophorus hellerii TaxID=8084 RepID=UPI0013B36203|nr:uncharacterized protein LOC116723092 isoform X4 [Xiphophorus hellerii]